MADLGAKSTDDEIIALEKELKAVYNKAYKEILQKQKDFNAKYAAKEAIHLKDVADGKWTQEEFDVWKAGQVFQGKQWESKKKQILGTTYKANTIAADIINGKTSGVFAFNANYTAYQLEHQAGVNFSFDLYDQSTVINLLKNDPQLLPQWKIDQQKDYTWNQKKLRRQVTLGVLEGESLDKIATRLADSLSSQNFNKMRTFARTAMTGAQNSGRQFRLEEAKALGINVKKEWMATLDAHTRMTHRKLDGQKVDLDKSFDINGMSIRFPGDPLAPAALVYNCRCTMVGDLVNYPATYDRYDNIDGKRIKGMTYEEWEEAKKKNEDISPVPLTFSQVGLYKQSAELLNLFKDKKMSNVYADIKSMNVTEGNKFYKELQGMGKPSEVWAQYVAGTLPDEQLEKIDQMLQAYADKAGLLETPLIEQFKNKKTSNVYTDLKSINTTVANKFYKELQGMGKPSEVWQQYLEGKLPKEQAAKIEAYLKLYDPNNIAAVPAPAPKKEPKPAAKPAVDIKDIKTLDDAQKALKEAQEAVNKAGADKTFIGIWQDPVTYADYEAKKNSINAKKQYYLDQINKYTNDPKWSKVSFAGQQLDKYNKYLKELEEFEKNGKAFSKLLKTLDDAKQKVVDLSPTPKIGATGKIFDLSLFTDKVKKLAKRFDADLVYAADRFHRRFLDSIWDNLTDAEKYSIWEYTRNSNPMNKSLSGYHDNWSRSNFLGLDKTVWGHEDSWRSLPGPFKKFGKNGNCTYHKAITDCTKAIEKSALPEGVMLVRGSDKSGFAGMIEGNLFSYEQAEKLLKKPVSEINKALKGQVIQNHAFTSTGIAEGTGFGGAVRYKIYAPKGTKAIYAEPQSYFGETVGASAELYKKDQYYKYVGDEAEVILQRGTEFRITNVREDSGGFGTIIVEMEVIAQPDYFKYGDEDTYNAGKTRHKK